MERQPQQRGPGDGLAWSVVEKGFYVASTETGIVGGIREQAGGEFSAHDANARTLGTFSTFGDAAHALATSTPDAADD